MKGFAFETVAVILASVFIVVVVIILLSNFLPDIFGSKFCVQKQIGNVNSIVNEAVSTRSTIIRNFDVETCIESIDFTSIRCSLIQKFPESVSEHRCFEFIEVGQASGNCIEDPAKIPPNIQNPVYVGEGCSNHKGTLFTLPGGFSIFDIQPYKRGNIDVYNFKPGRYSVEIGPYSIKFLQDSS